LLTSRPRQRQVIEKTGYLSSDPDGQGGVIDFCNMNAAEKAASPEVSRETRETEISLPFQWLMNK
jgi:hypothetical protein